MEIVIIKTVIDKQNFCEFRLQLHGVVGYEKLAVPKVNEKVDPSPGVESTQI